MNLFTVEDAITAVAWLIAAEETRHDGLLLDLPPLKESTLEALRKLSGEGAFTIDSGSEWFRYAHHLQLNEVSFYDTVEIGYITKPYRGLSVTFSVAGQKDFVVRNEYNIPDLTNAVAFTDYTVLVDPIKDDPNYVCGFFNDLPLDNDSIVFYDSKKRPNACVGEPFQLFTILPDGCVIAHVAGNYWVMPIITSLVSATKIGLIHRLQIG